MHYNTISCKNLWLLRLWWYNRLVLELQTRVCRFKSKHEVLFFHEINEKGVTVACLDISWENTAIYNNVAVVF